LEKVGFQKLLSICGVFDLNKCLVKTMVENVFLEKTSYKCLFKSVVKVIGGC
jgi:hypothetical protein